ncbi:MAG: GspH/FimT family pseudopilin [Gammaproteobacteria bacterium]|nr:GspH/FimT family pseudopilin [Gammaproteobacteria bacterium]
MNQQKNSQEIKSQDIFFSTQCGFTLVELIVTLGILIILVVIAFPSFQNWRKESEARQLFRKIAPTLSFARSSTLTYRTAVSICGGISSGCTGQWRDGMLTFTDLNHNGRIDHPSDHILQYTPLELHYGNLIWRGAGSRPYILFQESGLPLGSNGSLLYCGETSQYHRSVIMSMMGHVRPSPDLNQDGIYEGTDGRPLIC